MVNCKRSFIYLYGYQKNKSPKIVGSRFPSGEYKAQLTQYQKRYYARLYRTGQMARRGLAKIPMEKRIVMGHTVMEREYLKRRTSGVDI